MVKENSKITVTINGRDYAVPPEFSTTSLNDFLRVHLQLTGTKVMCREGGCGVCIVHAAIPTGDGNFQERSINSCLCPILSCDGWKITTVEGLGNQKHPHPIQKQMTEHYGTQCGYCTPGMVMSMYSAIRKEGKSLTDQQAESALDGNICRCTGYRPIVDAFKEFTKQSSESCDIEDFSKGICSKTGKECNGVCEDNGSNYFRPLSEVVRDAAPPWFKPTSLEELYKFLDSTALKNPYYVCGHTGIGVYDDGPYDGFIDLRGVRELFVIDKTENAIVIGGGVPLTDMIDFFNSEVRASPGFAYLEHFARLIGKTAHPAVRNVGSWGGNMALKNRHKEFPSDTFVAMVMCDAKIFVGPDERPYSPEEFVKMDLNKKIVTRLELKSFDKGYVFRTFKIMPRSANSHAYVNAGFRAKISSGSGKVIVNEKPVLAYGNISAEFVRAGGTEDFLTGKDLADNDTLQRALTMLAQEIQPENEKGEAVPKYKQSLSVNLFYKFALKVLDSVGLVDGKYKSAVTILDEERPVSKGTQSFPTTEKNWPVTKPIPKLESMVQCTGEARYISDIEQEGMLHAAFVLCTNGPAKIAGIDVSPAMALPGVIRVLTAKDIPGVNSFSGCIPSEKDEELLASDECVFYEQPVAIVVAVTKAIAEEASKLVKVEYKDARHAIVTCKDAAAREAFYESPEDLVVGDVEKAFAKAKNRVIGEFEIGTQAHFHMETQVCVVIPTEDGLNAEAGTQWIDHVQDCMAKVTGLNKNAINVTVKRNGGGFGAKITRNNVISAACGLAAYVTQRPVKMHTSLWDNMKIIGKRLAYYVKYEVGFDEGGKLDGIKLDMYGSNGVAENDSPFDEIKKWIDSGYKCPAWKLSMKKCKTNLPANTWCRAPGSTEAIYTIEHIMEHVAHAVGKPPIEIKQLNYYREGDKVLDGSKVRGSQLTEVTKEALDSAEYTKRLQSVNEFNKSNRWKKRGLSVVPIRYGVQWNGFNYSCLVTIYRNGGYVAVVHGGIEIGQGVNTKVAQCVAAELGIDMKYIMIQPSQAVINANNFTTGGSVTSELACMAAMEACKELMGRINPIKKKQKSDAEWSAIVEACHEAGVDLSARKLYVPVSTETIQYSTFGCTVLEVEIDVLTGEHQILRADVLYDCGESLSPLVDIGQVEGAIIMGFGYFTCEEVLYDEETGQNLSPSTWKYKPPLARDIPVEWNVKLLQNSQNPHGVLRSKVSAEPPLNMSCSVVFAIRDAIAASQAESGHQAAWFDFVAPMTVERIQLYCGSDIAQLRFRD